MQEPAAAEAAETPEPARASVPETTSAAPGESAQPSDPGREAAEAESHSKLQEIEEVAVEDQPPHEGSAPGCGDASEPVLEASPVNGHAAAEDREPACEPAAESVSAEELLADDSTASASATASATEETRLRAVLEAVIYVTEEPLTLAQIAAAVGQPREAVVGLMDQLVAEYERPEHGLAIREIAGGYKMATKPEHHEAVRAFVRSLKPPLKLSLAALETLAVIAYKQPITTPEIMEIRGVQGAGVLKTLLERKLIATAGRKNVIGKPVLYKTTREFLVQFGLRDLAELPSLKEFEELRRLALPDEEAPIAAEPDAESPEGEWLAVETAEVPDESGDTGAESGSDSGKTEPSDG